jgi:peptide/nickel transport system substrate-binding protein
MGGTTMSERGIRIAGKLASSFTKRALVRLTAVAAGVGLLGLQLGQTAAAQTMLVVAETFNIKTLDPSRSIEGTQMTVNKVLYDTLVTFEGEDVKTPRPSLATEWSTSEDGRSYTFKLRSGVTFASGNPLTAADVKWSLDRMINLKATTAFFVEGIESIEAPDAVTVVIRMKEATPALLAILATPSLGILDSKTVIANGGNAGPGANTTDKAEQYLNSKSAGSGAFVLESYTPDQEFVLVKNPKYWRGPAAIDRIVIRNITEASAQELALKKGDIDIALNIGQDQIASLEKAGVTVRASPVAVIFYLQMNIDPAVAGSFANPIVWQAVRSALDYEGLLTLAGPGATPLAGLMPAIFPGAPDANGAAKMDRAKAASLLKGANLSRVSGKLTFYQDATVNGVSMNLMAQKIQADLAAVGITLDLGGVPIPLAVAQWRAGTTPVGLFRWVADYADPANYLGFLPGAAVGKRSRWLEDTSPAAAELVQLGNEARKEPDAAKRAALYEKLQTRLVETGPYIPLFQPAAPYAYRPNVTGVTYHSVWRIDFATVKKRI